MADEHERQKRGFSADGTDEQVGTRWARSSNDQSKSKNGPHGYAGAEPGNGYRDSLANIAVDGKQRDHRRRQLVIKRIEQY